MTWLALIESIIATVSTRVVTLPIVDGEVLVTVAQNWPPPCRLENYQSGKTRENVSIDSRSLAIDEELL